MTVATIPPQSRGQSSAPAGQHSDYSRLQYEINIECQPCYFCQIRFEHITTLNLFGKVIYRSISL